MTLLYNTTALALIARLSVKKVMTSFESCFITDVLSSEGRALLNTYNCCCYLMHGLATTSMYAVFPQKSALEIILFLVTFSVDSHCVGRLLIQSHHIGLECNAIFKPIKSPKC